MKLEIAAVAALLASLVAGIAHADSTAPHAIEITPGTYLVCGSAHENAIGGRNADCKVVRVASSVVKASK